MRESVDALPCGWIGCDKEGELTFDGRRLCRYHFHAVARKQLEDHRGSLQRANYSERHRLATCKFLNEVVNQATTLMTKARLLAPAEREQFLELSLAAAQLFKRLQRHARISRNMPILIYRQSDSVYEQELTNTVNVSTGGACVSTMRQWRPGEKVWIEKPTNQQKALARVAWVKAIDPTQAVVGIEILESEDFWGLSES